MKKQISNYEIFNCSYGRSFSIITILNKLIKISNLDKKIEKIKASKSIKVNIRVNSKKAKKLLSWYPKIQLDEGLKKTIDWYQKNEKLL